MGSRPCGRSRTVELKRRMRERYPLGLSMKTVKHQRCVCVITAGFVLIFSGLVHSLAWLVTGESWDGPLSIRKPILFGISTGVTLISLGWVQHKIRPAKYDAIINPLFANRVADRSRFDLHAVLARPGIALQSRNAV